MSTEMGHVQNVPNDTAFSKIRLTTCCIYCWVQPSQVVSLILENAVSFGTFEELSFFFFFINL